jgi:hypothetical protein
MMVSGGSRHLTKVRPVALASSAEIQRVLPSVRSTPSTPTSRPARTSHIPAFTKSATKLLRSKPRPRAADSKSFLNSYLAEALDNSLFCLVRAQRPCRDSQRISLALFCSLFGHRCLLKTKGKVLVRSQRQLSPVLLTFRYYLVTTITTYCG